MRFLITSALLLISVNSIAGTKESKAIECFEEVTIQISIGLSQSYHGAKPGSLEEKKAKARMEKFTDIVEGYVAVPTACFENTDTEEEKSECIAETYSAGTLELAKRYKAMDVYRTTPACN